MINLSKPSISDKEMTAVSATLESRWLGMGKKCRLFEEECKKIIGCKHFIGLSSGTKAIEVALKAAGFNIGDEVIIPSITYASAIQVILKLGLVPVFVDSNPVDLNISIDNLEYALSEKSKFIIPVHFRGRSCKMDELRKFAFQHNLIIIEDAAHAFGSSYKNEKVGQNSEFACFSFGPIKNISCGSGGGIATNNSDLAAYIQSYRNMGIERSTWQRFEGKNKNLNPWDFEVVNSGDRCHLSDINAAIGLIQLDKIAEFKSKKKILVDRYDNAFIEVPKLNVLKTNTFSDFLYIYSLIVPTEDRTDLMKFLKEENIHTSIHYKPNHLQPFFKNRSRTPVSLQISEDFGSRLVSLPLYHDLSLNDQDFVIERVKLFFEN